MFIHQGPRRNYHFIGTGSGGIDCQDTSQYTISQGFNNVPPFNQRVHDKTFGSTAIVFSNDEILGDVYETAGQIPRICGLQRCVGKALARAVGRNKVLQNIEPFTEIRRNRCFNNGTVRLCHKSAHARQLPDLRRGTARA